MVKEGVLVGITAAGLGASVQSMIARADYLKTADQYAKELDAK